MILLFSATLLFGCMASEPQMSSVMSNCETSDFGAFNNCVQRNYKRKPNHPVTRRLYSTLNMIEESVTNGKTSNTAAKAYAWQAYELTWGAENRGNSAAAGANFLRAMENIQTQDRLSRESFNANRVKTTNCNTMGSRINCTSY